MTFQVEWARLQAAEIKALAARDAIVILPIGATEQHGHLPTMVDFCLVNAVALRAASLIAANEPVVVTPVIPFGMSEHHLSIGGTLTLDFATMQAVIRQLASSLIRQGFRRLFILNGHGGNNAALEVIIDELTMEHRISIAGGAYWEIAKEAIAAILENEPIFGHAGEAETSMMMVAAGVTVDAGVLAKAHGDYLPEKSYIERVNQSIYRWRQLSSITPTGVMGDAIAASPEKGERLMAAIATVVAQSIVEPRLWSTPI